jgi:predicted TIM-barrel fold metal-dependent hydrolase
MISRREFVLAIAGAASAARQTTIPRRQVSIGSRRVKVVDIHGHFIAQEELDVLRGTDLTGNISNQPRSLVLDAARVRTLDEQGIDVQVLTHQGAWWYGTERDLARELIKVQNEKLAAWCRSSSGRFVGLASVATATSGPCSSATRYRSSHAGSSGRWHLRPRLREDSGIAGV